MSVAQERTRAPGRREHVITVTVDESGGRTRAVARMRWHDGDLSGVGHTRPDELCPDRASERLAVSRALSDLAGRVRASAGA
jgi:hypothetical protein